MEVETKENLVVLTMLAFTAGTLQNHFGTEKVNGLLLCEAEAEKSVLGRGGIMVKGVVVFFTVLLILNTLKGH